MPSLFLEIPDHANTIRRLSMVSVVTNVLTQLGLEKDYIQFNDIDNNKAQPDSTIGVTHAVSVGTEEKVTVEMEEVREEFSLVNRGLGYKFQVPLFSDPNLGIEVIPAHANHTVTANLTMRYSTRGKATEWINQMHRRTALFGDVFETEATFHYPIPSEVMTILKILYLTGCKRVTPTLTFDEYLKTYLHPNATQIATDTGTDVTWAMRTTLGRVIVILQAPGELAIEQEEKTGVWNARLSYKFDIEWPEALKLDYPCTVNNSAIPEPLWHLRELPATVSLSGYERQDQVVAQDYLTTHYERIPLPVVMPPIGYPLLNRRVFSPTEKELIIAFIEFGQELPEVTTAEELAATTPKLICNLGELGDVSIDPVSLKYLKESYALDAKGKDSLFKVYVFKHTDVIKGRTTVDQNLDVWLNQTEVVLSNQYRFVLALELNPMTLSPAGKDCLLNNIGFLIKLITEFYPSLMPQWPWLFPGYVPALNISGGGFGDLTIDNWFNGHPPVWPDDYLDWWFNHGVIDEAIDNGDGSYDVKYNPSWPGWRDIIDAIYKDSASVIDTVHLFSSIIALKGVTDGTSN